VNGIKGFLPEPLLAEVEIADFKYEASEYPALVGKTFQVVFVHPRPEKIPFIARKNGTGLRAGAIYIRREGMSEEASYEEVDRVIRERLAAAPQTAAAQGLKEHLEELKVLYSEIPRHLPGTISLVGILGLTSFFPENKNYPSEEYHEFVGRLLDKKKTLIESLLGLSG
jgi:hypothetical protein